MGVKGTQSSDTDRPIERPFHPDVQLLRTRNPGEKGAETSSSKRRPSATRCFYLTEPAGSSRLYIHHIPVLASLAECISGRRLQSTSTTPLCLFSFGRSDCTADADLRPYDKHIENPSGVVDTAARLVSLKPGATTPMYRTVSLDCCVKLEGEIEFELDSGEKRTLRAGDTYVQRGTCHKFMNVTPEDGWAKFLL